MAALLSMLLVGVALVLGMHPSAATMDEDIELIWGASHTYFFMDGETESLALSLDDQQGSCFRSKDMYLYGTISMEIKLVDGNSAGVVATAYVRSLGLVSFTLRLCCDCTDLVETMVSQADLACQSSVVVHLVSITKKNPERCMPLCFQRRHLQSHAHAWPCASS